MIQQAKTSAILYVSSVVMFFFGFMLPLFDMIQRQGSSAADTMIELWQWNPSSEWGVILILLGLYHFWLGLRADRQGA